MKVMPVSRHEIFIGSGNKVHTPKKAGVSSGFSLISVIIYRVVKTRTKFNNSGFSPLVCLIVLLNGI